MSIIPRPLKLVLGRLMPFSLEDKVPTFNLGSGTADNTKLLRGDQTWQSIPTALPPSGVAGGKLSGTYPNPGLNANTSDVPDSSNKRYVTDAQLVVIGNTSGTNTGDQTSIIGITGTKAQFDIACSDGNFLYIGDVTQYTDELAQDAVGTMIDTSLVYNDATPLLSRAALTGAITATSGSNSTSLGSFTTAQLNTALSDNDIATGGGTATGSNTGDNAVNTLYSGLISNATHTGEVTGSVGLVLDKTAITNKSIVTGVGSDYVLISDTSDGGNLKKVLASDFAGGGGGVSEITSTLVMNFLSEDDVSITTVSSALLTTTNFKGFSIIPIETTETSLDDFKLNGVTFNIENIIDNTSFDIRATALNNATGNYTITYKIIYS
jgi:hypothetical protein